MVVTRSQGEPEDALAVMEERRRRAELNPPASPSTRPTSEPEPPAPVGRSDVGYHAERLRPGYSAIRSSAGHHVNIGSNIEPHHSGYTADRSDAGHHVVEGLTANPLHPGYPAHGSGAGHQSKQVRTSSAERVRAEAHGERVVSFERSPHEQQRATRLRSPARSVRSVRSNASSAARARVVELEAEEKLAALQRKELQIEADLVKKRLAADLAAIREDEGSLQGERDLNYHHARIDEWLQANPVTPRTARGEKTTTHAHTRERSTTPIGKRLDIMTTAMERLARPQTRCTDLPIFTGSSYEWLIFRASYYDATQLYRLSPTENMQRLRSCLKGEAREVVAARLYTAGDPEEIMTTLEQCFGSPEVIVDRAFEDLRKLVKPGPSALELNGFAVRVQNVVSVLNSIRQRDYLYNPMLVRETLEKLSPHLRSRWGDYASQQEDGTEPGLVVLARFLMREANLALRYGYAPTTTATKREAPRFVPAKKKSGVVYNVSDCVNERVQDRCTNERVQERCAKCEKDHRTVECPAYKALSTEKRWEFVRENRLCFKCLAKRHRRINCKAKPCGVNGCAVSHHASLHNKETPAEEAVMTVADATTRQKSVLLKMCPVTVVGPRGEQTTLALLDEGATVTLIDEKLARNIGADGPLLPLRMRGVSTTRNEHESRLVTVQLKKQSLLCPLRARTVKNMQLMQQTIPAALLDQEHLRDLPRSEVCYEASLPGILIGADHWEYIVSQELRTGKPDQPAASRTQLGWVIHGTIPRKIIASSDDDVLHIHTAENIMRNNDRLHDLVERHFSIDTMGIASKPRVSEADQRAIHCVENSITKTSTGYEVGLPWRSDGMKLPPSYDNALRRLHKIEQKMDADADFCTDYCQQVNNLLAKRYAEPCDGSEEESPVCWFLPHFAVTNPNKPGKRRLVFDAAAKSRGTSLNDHLLEGPDLLMSLLGILFRFREKRVAVTADIQEMFLQVKIRSCDQPAQQFLWRGRDRSQPPRRYKMTSMIFGAASSPFMAHYVRDYNAAVHRETHPLAYEAITKAHYMDDLVTSYDDAEEARRAVAELQKVHAQAGFTLRGWSSNYEHALQDVPADLRGKSAIKFDEKDSSESKILGLYWNAERDELGFNTSMSRVPADVRTRTRAPTKREALSAVMSIYDPLGLLSHFTIRAKIILQSLWRLKISWDEPIPDEEAAQFYAWMGHLRDAADLRLSRCYDTGEDADTELHVFCDASEQAYAAVAYWRSRRPDGSYNVRLVAAKAKVAPRRTQTIPRLELQAAVIGARLADSVKREHRTQVSKTTYWSDATTVLHWIANDSKRYTPYVAHRLGELAELTHKSEWRWVPTDENVADDATRFADTTITGAGRWFHGPAFLTRTEEYWPMRTTEEGGEEEVLHVMEESGDATDAWLPDPTRFSKYETLIRAAARVLFFVDRCRKRSSEMGQQHMQRAEHALLCRAQRDDFPDEIQRLKAARPIKRTSRLFRLDPVLDGGALKLRGRINAASAPASTKSPVILDGRNHITRLIVLREHCAAGHANRERVTNDLRQRYWILHLRPTVRKTENNCALCRLRKSRPHPPATGDLPRARLEPYQRPFSHCGCDYFGPVTVKIGRRHEKRWVALFTCLTTRAVHLELVPSLTVNSAVMALRRMAARRGWPKLIMSDNATNFRAADKELQAAYAEWTPALRDEALTHRMEWRFIPPGAPNQGGAWERMVRSVKTALTATLREKTPSEEVLHTLLTEAEFSVNARPLTHVSVSHRDPEALTPNHFLLGSSTGLPLTTTPPNEVDRNTWRASQALADSFWRRWLHEYLPTLVPRGEPTSQRRSLRVGDLVMVVDAAQPRNVWPRGVVERTYTGPDGGVRVADVRTRSGVFKRPASKIVVLVPEEATRAAPGGGC